MREELKRGIPKAIAVGKVDFTAEEQEQYGRDFKIILKKYGVLKENESIKDMNRPKLYVDFLI